MTTADVRRNQRLLRDVNARIAEIALALDETHSSFLCECGRPGCSELIDLPLTDIRALHAPDGLFAVRRGHLVPETDRFEESRDGYDVVRMK